MLYTPTAVRDRSIITITEVKSHLRLDGDSSFDTILQLYLDAAKSKADNYCCNMFQQAGVDQDIPMEVEIWLLQTVAKLFTNPEANVKKINLDNSLETDYVIGDYELDYMAIWQHRQEPGFGNYF